MIIIAGVAIILGSLFTIGLAISSFFRKSTAQKLSKFGLEPDNPDTDDIFGLNNTDAQKPTSSASLNSSLDLPGNVDISKEKEDMFATTEFSDISNDETGEDYFGKLF